MANSPEIEMEVLFCHRPTPKEQANAGFGVPFDWDIPILDGYPHRFLKNVARNSATSSFGRLDTPELSKIIANNNYHGVLVNGWHYKSAWQAIRACWATKTPVLVRGDSHLHTPRHPLKKVLKSAPYRWLIPKFDACLAAGKWSAEYFLHYGARRDRIFLVPHVIDERWFGSECERWKDKRSELRCKWKLGHDKVVFLFAGKFTLDKRPLDFVLAIDRAARRGGRVNGLMVGDGPLRHQCEQAARDRKAPVRFAGFLNQSQIASAYAACNVLVLPSESETWGMVVNEAMAGKRPCIVSNRVGCGPDLVIPGETGFIFPFSNIDALANLMLQCASDPSILAGMGERSRNRAERYSTSAALDGVLQALSALKTVRRTSA